jgi:transposase
MLQRAPVTTGFIADEASGNCHGRMGLASAGAADQNDITLLGDEAAARGVLDERLVDRRAVDVEVVELHAGGLPIMVLEARHRRVSLSTMRNKTDRSDARGIAQMMRLGWFRAVHVKNVEMQKMRTLVTNRKRQAQAG